MAETYGELVCRLCQLRDQMRRTAEGVRALREVTDALALAIRRGITYEEAKEASGT